MMNSNKNIPKSVIERIPLYLNYLNYLVKKQTEMISSTRLAMDLGLGEVQVRKDLNLIAGNGKPKIGYYVIDLKTKIERLISQYDTNDVIIIGAGKIGKALAMYDGFEENNFSIVGLFDSDPSLIGKSINNHPILSLDELKKFSHVKIAILAVPAEVAQSICDQLVAVGIKGILNFTNQKLIVNDDIKIRNIDIAALLTILSIEINNN